jgi:hypothetical protein
MRKVFTVIIIQLILLLFVSCEFEKRIPPKGYLPNTPKATPQLEASYFWIPQDQIGSDYWKDANYLEISLSNLSIHNQYTDGYLNMTGTYNGLADFNQGRDPQATLKAGYDDEYIYIMVEWKDTTADPSYMSWLFDGPSDIHKPDTTGGWTSQRNNDSFVLLFDVDGSDTKDAWKWSLALTAPFDMAYNLSVDASGTLTDASNKIIRNASDSSSRSGPLYEWDGNRQEITLPDSTRKLLDPAYFLLEDHKTVYTGDPAGGSVAFNQKADCKFCHGPGGNGEFEGSNGGKLSDVKTLRLSRTDLISFISSTEHEGSSNQYFGRIKNDPAEVTDLLAYLRGIAGLPGYRLIAPITDPDIKALTNIGLGTINPNNSSYKVLLIRPLNTGESGDVVFSPDQVYSFSIRFSDNDDINFVGASNLQLIFKSKEL